MARYKTKRGRVVGIPDANLTAPIRDPEPPPSEPMTLELPMGSFFGQVLYTVGSRERALVEKGLLGQWPAREPYRQAAPAALSYRRRRSHRRG